ncbi:hypothetical protein B8A06_14355, partial [Staphylococcus aureus]
EWVVWLTDWKAPVVGCQIVAWVFLPPVKSMRLLPPQVKMCPSGRLAALAKAKGQGMTALHRPTRHQSVGAAAW